MELTLERLQQAVDEDAAIRRIRQLQPTGGQGDKLFPPTYPGDGANQPARHAFERRRIDGQNVLCVLLDSVQSQANRLEEALREECAARRVRIPVITVDFSASSDVADVGSITSLDAPHRVFDAIIRDSELPTATGAGTVFRESEAGRRLLQATQHRARALFELSPTALLFGAWNSTGGAGAFGARFPRCLVSEIVGIGVATDPIVDRRTGTVEERPSGVRVSSRIDPLGIRAGVRLYKPKGGDWTLDAPTGQKATGKPSDVNHSNIAPSVDQLGVSIDSARHIVVLSLAALRRLRMGEGSQDPSPAADLAARTALAALGLVAILVQDRQGYFLRSRCDLVPDPGVEAPLTLLHANGSTDTWELSLESAEELLKEAAEAARVQGLSWNSSDVVLRPQGKLVELIRASRRLALVDDDSSDAS